MKLSLLIIKYISLPQFRFFYQILQFHLNKLFKPISLSPLYISALSPPNSLIIPPTLPTLPFKVCMYVCMTEFFCFIITGYFTSERMSRRNGPELELKLNLSPQRLHPRVESPAVADISSELCVSSKMNNDVDMTDAIEYSNSPEATSSLSSMVLVGCPRCLMYVMLSENDSKCSQCKSTVLLDFLHDTATTTTNVETRNS